MFPDGQFTKTDSNSILKSKIYSCPVHENIFCFCLEPLKSYNTMINITDTGSKETGNLMSIVNGIKTRLQTAIHSHSDLNSRVTVISFAQPNKISKVGHFGSLVYNLTWQLP